MGGWDGQHGVGGGGWLARGAGECAGHAPPPGRVRANTSRPKAVVCTREKYKSFGGAEAASCGVLGGGGGSRVRYV